MSRSVFARLARRLGHPDSAWVVIRALTLWLGVVKLLLWYRSDPLDWAWVWVGVLWIGWLAVYANR